MKDLGESKRMFGMQIKYNINKKIAHISDYISASYNKYATILTVVCNYRTPMAVNKHPSEATLPVYTAGKEYTSKVLYREVLGAFLLRSLICRPDKEWGYIYIKAPWKIT